MVLWRKQVNIEKKLDAYFDRCDQCYERFEEALRLYFESGLSEEFEAAVEKVHRSESKADDQRREIEYLLYGKALLPESRGDLLGLIETYDRLPNIAETIAFALEVQRVRLPEALVDQYRALFELNLKSYHLARKCVNTLMQNPAAVLAATRDVDAKESESDRVERTLLRDIFDSDMDMGTKLLLKDLALLFGEVSDRAEEVADRVAITAIKRQI